MKSMITILAAVVFITACGKATPITTQEPSPTAGLPTAVVQVTKAPSAESAVRGFLDAWKAEDYPGMYALLTPISKDAVSLEDFIERYKDATLNLTLLQIDYEIISTLTNPSNAQATVRVSYDTVLLDKIQRDLTFNLDLNSGSWLVQWEDGLILPELKGGNRLSLDVKIPARGNIYDRFESAIAAQTDAVAIGIIPSFILPDDEGTLLLTLSRVTGIPGMWIRSLYFGNENYYIMVGEATQDAYNRFAGTLASLSGVDVSAYNTRFYYEGGVAPQTVGYVQLMPAELLDEYRRKGYLGDEKVGISGLESWGEDYLAGTHGGNLYVIDPQGQIVTRLASAEPKPAQSIYTTLDKDLQVGAQKALAGFNGAAVVLERDTGRVLALASSPAYDPNLFDPNNANFQFLSQMLNDFNQPLLNRAAQGQYPLGSVFKIITMAAGLESKQFKATDQYACGHEFTELEGITLYDWTYEKELPPSGNLTYPEGLMRSCNPWFWHIGLELYNRNLPSAVPDMARAFGLGKETGIGAVAESVGNVPDAQSQGDATQLAIGQGELLVTPLQVAQFIAAVGNGGTLYRPQIIEKIAPPDGAPTVLFKPEINGTLPVSPENLKIIQDAMYSVIENARGTAHRTFIGMNVPIYGKTGTAQTPPNDPHAWFAGYTDAKNPSKPDIAIVVLVENKGDGSEWAAPIFRRIVEIYFNGQIGRPYPWESTYYVTETPTLPVTETVEPTPTPKKRR